MAIEEKKFLGTAGVQQLITNTREEIAAAEAAAKKYADDLAVNYDAAGTAATKVQELADGQVKTNKEAIGTMDNLETTAKSDLVTAINEVRNAVSVGGTAAAITMTEQTSDLGEGVLKAYVIKQGENTVGTINIPKDMVVQAGEVVVDPEGQPAGTYIKLTLANATNDVIYVNVGTLVDIYKAKASAAQVQVAIDSATREISASIVAGSITATELAADAVTTVKIADGNVTKAKLSSEVQASLDKADAAAGLAQTAENNAKAHADGLNTAMNTRVEALEAIDHEHANAAVLNGITAEKVAAWDGAQAAAEATAASALSASKTELEGKIADGDKANKDLIDGLDGRVGTAESDIDKLEAALAEGGAVDIKIAAAKSGAEATASADATAKANKALADAQAYADSKVAGVDLSGIATNAADIDKLEASLAEGGATANAIADAKKAGTDAATAVTTLENGKVATLRTDVDALMSVSYVEITASEIDAMFAVE